MDWELGRISDPGDREKKALYGIVLYGCACRIAPFFRGKDYFGSGYFFSLGAGAWLFIFAWYDPGFFSQAGSCIYKQNKKVDIYPGIFYFSHSCVFADASK